MSSHHIVKEKQEPALLIMSLDDFEHEHLGQILEWSPTIVVDERVYEKADTMGIKVDAVISRDTDFNAQEHTLIILSKNNPLEDGLKYLVGEQYPAGNIITDRFVLKEYAMFADDIQLVIFSNDKKIYPVRPGFSKWMAANEMIFLMHEVSQLDTSGLTPHGKNSFLTEKDGFFTLTFTQPFIFIAENI